MVFRSHSLHAPTLLTDGVDVFVNLSRVHFLCTTDNIDTIPTSLHGSFGGLDMYPKKRPWLHGAIWVLSEGTRAG